MTTAPDTGAAARALGGQRGVSTPPSPEAVPDPQVRFPAVDYIKAAAIVAVVFTHGGVAPWSPEWSSWDYALRRSWVSFHVPSFLIVSGFLYARVSPVDLSGVGARLGRVLLPYLIASAVVFLTPFALDSGFRGIATALATASALRIYYYIFAFACCTPLIWPLSCMGRVIPVVVLAALVVYFVALPFYPRMRLVWSLFWIMRDPLAMFYFGYFIVGWLAALWLPGIAALCDRYRGVAWLLCVAGIGIWVGTQAGQFFPASVQLFRPIYTLGVIGIVVFLTRRLRVPSAVRFLSEATLPIYLWHHVFQLATLDYTLAWHPAARILAMFAVGIGGSVAVCLLSRRLLGGPWSRRLIGV